MQVDPQSYSCIIGVKRASWKFRTVSGFRFRDWQTMSALWLQLCCVGLLALGARSEDAEGPIVSTKYGAVEGIKGTVSGKD